MAQDSSQSPVIKQDLMDMEARLLAHSTDLEARSLGRSTELETRLMAHVAETETRLLTHAEQMETRLLTHAEQMERRMMEYVDKRVEKVETSLLSAFHGWSRTMEIRTRLASSTASALDERLALAEERISELERRK